MKRKIALLFAAALLSVSCRNDKGMRREQKNYDVVQEGSAGAVTSTISGPGETPPPLTTSYPTTATNADTTTAFTLPSTQPVEMQPATTPPPTMIRPRPKPVRREESGTTMATDTVTTTSTTTTTIPPEQTETTETAPVTDTTTTTKPPR